MPEPSLEVVTWSCSSGYASTHGSTREIAERIGARLGEHGHRADVRRLDQVKDTAGYDGFVLGSAVYGGPIRPATGPGCC